MGVGVILGIDPGENHNGLAWFDDGVVVRVEEWTPEVVYDYLEKATGVEKVALESYHLFPWLLQQQGFSEVKTAQTIGVIRYICSRKRIMVIMQPASIKKPTFARMRARGVKLVGTGQHIKDAQAHAYHLINNPGPRQRKR